MPRGPSIHHAKDDALCGSAAAAALLPAARALAARAPSSLVAAALSETHFAAARWRGAIARGAAGDYI